MYIGNRRKNKFSSAIRDSEIKSFHIRRKEPYFEHFIWCASTGENAEQSNLKCAVHSANRRRMKTEKKKLTIYIHG